jgi:two-component system, NtrC family, response regulator AtoC
MHGPVPMTSSARVLIVDDEVAARTALAEILRDEGYTVDTAGDGFKALARIEEVRPDLVLTDLRMPSMDGLELIRRLRRAESEVPVVVMTAFGAVDSAILAVREGAVDFVVKPLDTKQLLLVVERALERRAPRADGAATEKPSLPGMVCHSPEMRDVARLTRTAAPSRAAVLLVGERGTGRERLARAIHAMSRQASGPFQSVDLGELVMAPSDGEPSFNEAMTALVRSARGGTLYLRDVHALPRFAALALVDVLNENLGADGPRIISSTDRDLRYLAAFGEFESTLLFRIAVVKIELPPLRERRQDLSDLARELLLERTGVTKELSDDAIQLVQAHNWPRNVSELALTLVAARERANGDAISARHIELMAPEDGDAAPPPIPGATLADIERYAIMRTLEAHGHSTSRAARVLGISVRKIQYKLHEYGRARGRGDVDHAGSEPS